MKVEQVEYLDICADGVRVLRSGATAIVDTWALDAEEAERMGRDLIEAARILRSTSA